jgi:glycosyltransferase involved in cell wall biosynthesis
MDLFAFPSRAEAFGLVLIEAMAAGKPVVSTRCDGVLDIVEHETNGLLFASGNSAEFIASVKKLMEQPVFRDLLAANGRKTVAQKFSRARSLHQLLNLYEKSLAKK